MSHFGKREQLMLCIVVSLLLMSWAIKAYFTAHPAVPVAGQMKR